MAIKMKVKKKVVSRGPRTLPGRSASSESTGKPRYQEKTPPCQIACPSSEGIRTYLTLIAQGEEYQRTEEQSLTRAWEVLTDKNPIPATMGRVCPHPCQEGCNRKDHDTAVGINSVEQHIGDFAIQNGLTFKKSNENYPEKVAVVGSGPAGLSTAYQLARRGYPVTLFEAFEETGGMLRYGIPAYRLPRAVLDAEIQNILDLGIELKTNTRVGVDISLEEMRKTYSAIFLGNGCHRGKKLNVTGEEAPNVFTGAEYLNRVNQGEKVDLGKRVLVIGGGDSAVDAARVALREGAEVTMLYRRTRQEMPAISRDVDEAIEEGVQLELLTAPKEIVLKHGQATALECYRMELGEPDDSGRRRPVRIEDSEFTVTADSIIAAVSQEPEMPGLDPVLNQWGWVDVDKHGRTQIEGIFAGGDVLDIALVTTAVGQGRVAAETIHKTLRGHPVEDPKSPQVVYYKEMKIASTFYPKTARHERGAKPVSDRIGNYNEFLVPLTREQVVAEAKRCMSCGMCFDCDNCFLYCSDTAVVRQPKGEHFKFDLNKCSGCDKCFNQCPCGYIDWIA